MTEIENAVTLQDIREIVRQIVQRFRPQKVILFGSYAQGKPTPDSDVDLLSYGDERTVSARRSPYLRCH